MTLFSFCDTKLSYRGHIRNINQLEKAQKLLEEYQAKNEEQQLTSISSSTSKTSSQAPRSARRTRNPSNTHSTTSTSTSTSKTKSKKKNKDIVVEINGITKSEITQMNNKEFRQFWKENGLSEKIKKLPAGSLKPGSSVRNTQEKKLWEYLEN